MHNMYIYYYLYKMLDPEKSPLPSPMFGIIDIFKYIPKFASYIIGIFVLLFIW